MVFALYIIAAALIYIALLLTSMAIDQAKVAEAENTWNRNIHQDLDRIGSIMREDQIMRKAGGTN